MNYIWKLNKLNEIEKNGYKVFSCFSGGGGSSLGYKLAGHEVLGNVEIDQEMMGIYKENNNPKYPFLMGVQDFKNLKDIPEELYDLDILDGSPPCSTFSRSGAREKGWGVEKVFREGQQSQLLSELFFDFIEVAKKLKPKIVISENVKGLIEGNAKYYVKAIVEEFDKAGYETQIFLLDSSYMGVPQKRERVFFVSIRKDLEFKGDLSLEFNEKEIPYFEVERTLKNKLGKKLSAISKKYWDRVKVGESFSKAHPNGSYFNSKKINPNKVLNTIAASEGSKLSHYEKPYVISDEAIIKCSSFPVDYNFGTVGARYVCGMSVPPLMMYRVAKEIKNQILDKLTGET